MLHKLRIKSVSTLQNLNIFMSAAVCYSGFDSTMFLGYF